MRPGFYHFIKKMFMYRYNPAAYEYHYTHFPSAQYSPVSWHTIAR